MLRRTLSDAAPSTMTPLAIATTVATTAVVVTECLQSCRSLSMAVAAAAKATLGCNTVAAAAEKAISGCMSCSLRCQEGLT